MDDEQQPCLPDRRRPDAAGLVCRRSLEPAIASTWALASNRISLRRQLSGQTQRRPRDSYATIAATSRSGRLPAWRSSANSAALAEPSVRRDSANDGPLATWTSSGSRPPRSAGGSIRDRAAVSPAVSTLFLSDKSSHEIVAAGEPSPARTHVSVAIAAGFGITRSACPKDGVARPARRSLSVSDLRHRAAPIRRR